MGSLLYVRRGGSAGAASTQLVDVAPYFDQPGTPRIQLGMKYGGGEATQGTFVVLDSSARMPAADLSFTLGARMQVKWTENAAGCEYWLAVGRILTTDEGRGVRRDYRAAEWSATIEDSNVDLRGQAFTEAWVRPSETDYARLVALQQYCLNDVSSTAPYHRLTTTITVHDTHLARNANTVTMPATTYPIGTQPQDVIDDCATTAGKDYGVVIHHGTGGGGTTLLEAWTWDGTAAATYTLHAANSKSGLDVVVSGVGVTCGSGGGGAPSTGTEGTNCYVGVQVGGVLPTAGYVKAAPGDVFGLHGWSFPYAELTCQIRISWVNAANAEIGSERLGPLFGPGAWTEWSGTTGAAPAGTAGFQFGVCKNADGTYKDSWYDQVTIYSGGLPTSGSGIASDVGNCSHLCLQYIVPSDLTTNPCTLKISDARADVDEDTVTPPTVYGPRWIQGKATNRDGQRVLSGIISTYQTPSGTGSVFARSTTRESRNDYWVDPVSDSFSQTPAQAQVRASAILQTFLDEHITHRVSVPIAADQTYKIAAGMAIAVKAAAMLGGNALGTYQTRRIAQLVWEPRNDGYYWAHMELDRPERLTQGNPQLGAAAGDPTRATIASGTYAGQTVQQAINSLSAANPLTTLGDLLYRGSGGSNTRLAIGASNFHLTSDGAAPLWSPQTALNDPMTTIGDIIVRNASNATARLGIGASNTVLTALGGGTAPVWATVASGGTTSPLTTKGDVYTYSSTNARLGVGTDGQVLTADSTTSTGNKWATLPADAGTRVYNSAAFSVAASAETAITFDTERSDSDAFHSTSSNTSRLTVPSGKAGRYAIAGTVEWAASALGTLRRLSIRLNGTTYIAKDEITSIINAALPQSVETVYDLVATDYVELVAFQDTVGAVNLQASGNYSPEFGMMLAGSSATAGTSLLAVTNYNPGTVAVITTSSTSLADADATNLIVTFTAPASGNVLIRLTASGSVDTGVGLGNSCFWSLRESTTNLTMPIAMARYTGSSGTADIRRMSTSIYLTGLPAGSHTYKWAYCVSAGTTSIRSGGSATGDLAGPSVMEVWSA